MSENQEVVEEHRGQNTNSFTARPDVLSHNKHIRNREKRSLICQLPFSLLMFFAFYVHRYPFFCQGLVNLAYFWQGFLESTCRTGILQGMKQE
jgi:hypothetical protein